MLFTKLSILAFYIRTFESRRFRGVALVATGICFIWAIGGMVPTIVQCQPIATLWNPNLPGRCLDLHQLSLGLAISNLLTDILVLCLPIYMVWTLTLSFRNRVAVSIVFIAGGLVCIVALLRITTEAQANWPDLTCMSQPSTPSLSNPTNN